MKKAVIKDFMSLQLGMAIHYAQYDTDGEIEIDRLDENIGYNLDIGFITNIVDLDVLFTSGYKINTIKDEDDIQLFNGPFLGIGIFLAN